MQQEMTTPVNNDLDSLFVTYGDMIYRLALVRTRSAADAEDVVQEVFLRCLKNNPSFDSAEHQKAWLITAAINSSKSLLDRADRRHGAGAEALEFLSTEDDTDNSVYNAVMQLPDKYRTAVHLFYYEGYSVEEIGKMTDTNPSTVKSHLHRAREALRRVLKEDEPDV